MGLFYCRCYYSFSSSLPSFIQTAKGQQKALLATPAETAPYGVPFIPGPGPPGVGGPVLQYMQPVEGMPPLAMAMDPAMMMGNWEELGHFHGGLFIPHVHPEGQRMMMPVPGDSPQHVQPTPHQPKQRSRAIPIVAPQTTQEVCTRICSVCLLCVTLARVATLAVCICMCVCVCACMCMCACVHVDETAHYSFCLPTPALSLYYTLYCRVNKHWTLWSQSASSPVIQS